MTKSVPSLNAICTSRLLLSALHHHEHASNKTQSWGAAICCFF